MHDNARLATPTEWSDGHRGWHFDKTISIGNLIAVTPLLLAMVASWVSMQHRLDYLEQQRREDVARYEKQRAEDHQHTMQARQEVVIRIDGVDKKLDRLIERTR